MRRVLHFILLLLAVAPAAGLHAQIDPMWDSGRLETTREGLLGLMVRYEQTAASPNYSAEIRASAHRQAEAIRSRLTLGDFRTGDVIDLRVEGEQSLTDTFVVNSDGAILLPVVGSISLYGVLRSELAEHIRAELARYLVEPQVTASSSIRVIFTGSMTPGIFEVPTQELLSAALMRAGGPAGATDVTAMRIERGKEVLWKGDQLQSAIAQGLTIEQLELRSGDHVIIPPVRSRPSLGTIVTTVIPALLLTITTLTQIL
jgi:protein involved in polysaccharide export with SLBB domain